MIRGAEVGLVVSGSGGAFAAVQLLHVYQMGYSPVVALLIDGVPLLFAIGIVYAGYRLVRSELERFHARRIAAWYLGGVVVLLGIAAGLQLHMAVHGHPLEHPLSTYATLGVIGGLAGLLVGRYDTKRRVHLEEVISERDRLDEFASIVSHDLRNPLNVAAGQTKLAREECDSDHLEEVVRAHERMEALIEDLLTLARSGRHVDEVESVVLADVVERCWQTVVTDDAKLVVDTEQTIRADPNRLQQLIENLLGNAVEHGGEAVTITVGDLEAGNGFYVVDDGTGIPGDERERVFDAGYSTATDGSGLGLRIVEQIAIAHGWEVDVTAGDDGGARFEFTNVEVDR